ncbi:MAG: pilus assembly protein PilP [Planctomycetales bacterium]|nr:pilus assembly protein PilP [Planctomycetales bacterium]
MAKLGVQFLSLAILVTWSSILQARERQALERFQLGELSYLGYEYGHREPVARVRDPDGYVHTVLEGNYLGKKGGVVVQITIHRMIVSEVHSDGSGWGESRHYLQAEDRKGESPSPLEGTE